RVSVLSAQRLQAIALILPGIRKQFLLGLWVYSTAPRRIFCKTKRAKSWKHTLSQSVLAILALDPSIRGLSRLVVLNTMLSLMPRRLGASAALPSWKASFPSLEASHAIYQAMQVASAMASN
ncbi:hypothetical protein IW140_006493, partial [Coemansia sp. RSA 1813]